MLRRATRYLVVHCAATTPDMDIGVDEIRRWHVEQRGWSNVGYHFVIRRNGAVEAGRHVAEVGTHVAGHNEDSVGICLVGGLDADGQPAPTFTDAQWNSLHGLLVSLQHQYPTAQILGHRDFPGVDKACPCFDVRGWVAARPGLTG